jgi:hypothetical protein
VTEFKNVSIATLRKYIDWTHTLWRGQSLVNTHA